MKRICLIALLPIALFILVPWTSARGDAIEPDGVMPDRLSGLTVAQAFPSSGTSVRVQVEPPAGEEPDRPPPPIPERHKTCPSTRYLNCMPRISEEVRPCAALNT